MNELKRIEPEYIYVTIPAEYICVYHRILAMLADYGEDMLKDCKASCTDKNSGVIECFNMFNSAVAARKLGNQKLADIIIKYIKAKINQIYKGKDNSTSFIFPVDESGNLKAFVSCGKNPTFEINSNDMNLYEHKFGEGYDEHFKLGPEDYSKDINITIPSSPVESIGLDVILTPRYEEIEGVMRPCADVVAFYNGKPVNINNTIFQYYFDDEPVDRFDDVVNLSTGVHNFKIVVTFKDETKIKSIDKAYTPYAIDTPNKPTNTNLKFYQITTDKNIKQKTMPYNAKVGVVYKTNRIKIRFPKNANYPCVINRNKLPDYIESICYKLDDGMIAMFDQANYVKEEPNTITILKPCSFVIFLNENTSKNDTMKYYYKDIDGTIKELPNSNIFDLGYRFYQPDLGITDDELQKYINGEPIRVKLEIQHYKRYFKYGTRIYRWAKYKRLIKRKNYTTINCKRVIRLRRVSHNGAYKSDWYYAFIKPMGASGQYRVVKLTK